MPFSEFPSFLGGWGRGCASYLLAVSAFCNAGLIILDTGFGSINGPLDQCDCRFDYHRWSRIYGLQMNWEKEKPPYFVPYQLVLF